MTDQDLANQMADARLAGANLTCSIAARRKAARDEEIAYLDLDILADPEWDAFDADQQERDSHGV